MERPNIVGQTRRLCGRLAVCAVLPNEVVMKDHQIDGVNQVFKLLAVAEREPSDPAIEQANGQVRAFNVAGADSAWFRIAATNNFACASAAGW